MENIIKKLKRVHYAEILGKAFLYVLLINLAFVFLYPFFYMILTSLKSPQDISDITVNWLLNSLHFDNFRLAFASLEYVGALFRTIFLVLACTLGHIISCALVGYGFARFNFRGKGLFFVMLLMSIIVPLQTIIVPQYMLFASLGLSASYFAIIIPTWFGFGLSGGLFIFIFRQFYLSLPRSLEEAASIDGCGIIQTFVKIAFPASRSSIIVCVVLSLVWHWNDYFEPSIYITESSQFLLPMQLPGLYTLMQSASTDISAGALDNIYTEGVAMAATTLVVLPMLIMYFFLQKQFVLGVERSGITGE